MTPTYALVHVFVPNLLKLKGAATLVSALERKEKVFLDQLWSQAYVTHDPQITTVLREPYRIGVISLPPPKEIGEAYLVGIVVKKSDPAFVALLHARARLRAREEGEPHAAVRARRAEAHQARRGAGAHRDAERPTPARSSTRSWS